MDALGRFFYRMGAGMFFLSVVLLVWRRNHYITFGVYIPTIKFSDLLLLGSLIFVCGALLLSHSLRDFLLKEWKAFSRWVFLWGAFICFFILGSFIGFLVFHVNFFSGSIEYIRLGIGLTEFFLIIIFGFHNDRYIRLIAYAFFSALLLIPFLFVSIATIFEWFAVVSPASYTLLGLQPSPLVLGSFLIIPATFLFAYVCADKTFKKYLALIGVTFFVALIIWTGSRSAWISSFIALLSIVLVHARQRAWSWVALIRGGFFIVLVFLFGFLILPAPARNTALVRIFPYLKVDVVVVDNNLVLPKESEFQHYLLSWTTWDFLRVSSPVVDLGFREDRGAIWMKYGWRFLENPLGVGPLYASILPEHNISKQGVNAHNLWLQVALSGGIGALIVFGYIIFEIGRRLWRLVWRYADDVLVLGLAGAFVGMLVNAIFMDTLDIRWFWIILGIITVIWENKKEEFFI